MIVHWVCQESALNLHATFCGFLGGDLPIFKKKQLLFVSMSVCAS